MKFRKIAKTGVLGILLTAGVASAETKTQEQQKVDQLEKMVEKMMAELQELKKQQASKQAEPVTKKEAPATTLSESEVTHLKELAAANERGDLDKFTDQSTWHNRLRLGGYGEIHYNGGESDSKSKMDLHRLVLFAGYDFNDWLSFNSEIEVEHAFVKDDNGYLMVEQAFFEAKLYDSFNLRFGRMLAPLGITNQRHEPNTFNGVERPLFDKYIIPTTWSIDGFGAFGKITDRISYEAYLTAGLDGSGFDAKGGIRNGRMKERPSMNDTAISGRIDYFAIKPGELGSQSLRIGVSGFYGGMNNTDGGGESGTEGDVTILSADYEYTVGIVDFRGAIAQTTISDVSSLADGVGDKHFGFYQDIGVHVLPDSWKTGKLAESDVVLFGRYDYVDTQAGLPSDSTEVGAAKRSELTLGVTFHVTPQFVVKADYQIRNDDSDNDLSNLYNFGVGYSF